MLLGLLVGSAHALSCTELVHLARSEGEEQASQRARGGWRFDPPTLQCVRDALGGGVLSNTMAEPRRTYASWRVQYKAPEPVTLVSIDVGCGTLTVHGTDAPTPGVQGFADADSLSFSVKEGVLSINDANANHWCSDLTVTMPHSASLVAATSGTAVQIRNVDGAIDVNSASARVDVMGGTGGVEVSTVRGNVLVRGGGAIEVNTGSGLVEVGGEANGAIEVQTITGDVWVWGGPLRELTVETVSGQIRATPAYQASADVRVISTSGAIVMAMPKDVRTRPSQTNPATGLDAQMFLNPASYLRVNPLRPNTNSGVCFGCLSPEVRGIFVRETAPGVHTDYGTSLNMSLTTATTGHRVTVEARSFSGSLTPLHTNDAAPVGGGLVARKVADQRPTLAKCRADAVPVTPKHEAVVYIQEGKPTLITTDHPRKSCIQEVVGKWEFPNVSGQISLGLPKG